MASFAIRQRAVAASKRRSPASNNDDPGAAAYFFVPSCLRAFVPGLRKKKPASDEARGSHFDFGWRN